MHQLIRLVPNVEGYVTQLPRIGAVEGGGCRETVVDQAAWGISRDDEGGNHVGPPMWRETGLREVGGAEV